jgi:hypothetical protein
MTRLVLIVPLLLGCAAGSGASPSAADGGPVPGQLFGRLLADAAERAGVDKSAVSVISSQAVTWADGSLGCPEPGKAYTQALVPGYRVILEAGGSQYDYHTARSGGFVLCPPERAQPPSGQDIY